MAAEERERLKLEDALAKHALNGSRQLQAGVYTRDASKAEPEHACMHRRADGGEEKEPVELRLMEMLWLKEWSWGGRRVQLEWCWKLQETSVVGSGGVP